MGTTWKRGLVTHGALLQIWLYSFQTFQYDRGHIAGENSYVEMKAAGTDRNIASIYESIKLLHVSDALLTFHIS